MKILFHTSILCLLAGIAAWGQGNNKLWFAYTGSVVDFRGPMPRLIPAPTAQSLALGSLQFPGYFPESQLGAQAAVADTAGNLRFFVKVLKVPQNGALGPQYSRWPKIFDRNGYSMPNADINANWENPAEHPLIIPHPGNNHQYYVFYCRNQGLQYSIIDMQLNNGLGDVVPGQKDILLSGWGTINETKITSLPGCNCVWLVIRSRTANQYFSYRIDSYGLHNIPAVSNCGLLPLKDYNTFYVQDGINWAVGMPGTGRLAASKDGTLLATGTARGIECYDFDQCSGNLKNARLIDSLPFFGICFSPDGSRLYASQVYPLPHYGQQGQVYQYNLRLGDVQRINNSKTLVLSANVMACYNPVLGCYCDTLSMRLGDLRLGPDDKIYLSNDKRYCALNIPVYPPQPGNPDHTLHVIHRPNELGMACSPEMDYLALNTPLADILTNPVDGILMYLPHTPATFTAPADTLRGNTIHLSSCFSDSLQLTIPGEWGCPEWDDGLNGYKRVVYQPGKYWVTYAQHCRIRTDTFLVTFIPLPRVPALTYACIGEGQLNIKQPPGTAAAYRYRLLHHGEIIDNSLSATGYSFNSLPPGDYQIQIITGDCDTLIPFRVVSYPSPRLQARPRDTTIFYGDTISLMATGAEAYLWQPAASLDAATRFDPLARPLQSTVYTVTGWNAYGCTDSATVRVTIDYTSSELIPNAFSPNGDGLNDVFRVEGARYQGPTLFKVYNRYGQEVYASESRDAAWEGTYRGMPCDAGTYYYYIRIRYPDGREKTFKGDVILLR